MKNNIFKILEKYDIDEFHWKLEITDEIISAFQTQKPMKDWKAIAEKKDELIVYLKSISISKSPNEEYENKLLTELATLESQEVNDEDVMKDYISFANYFHKWKQRIQRGECPKRPDEIYKIWNVIK